MKLWTWQTRDFSLHNGLIDHNKSEYVQNKELYISDANKKLFSLLGTNQVIWCYTRKKQPWRKRVEWSLDVPLGDILAFCDDTIWCRIIKQEHFEPPRELERQWEKKAMEIFPSDPAKAHEYEDSSRQAFLDEPEPKEGWWSRLFVDPSAGETVNALVQYPVPKEWCINDP